MSYLGIENSNDFYSDHYLAAIMAGDLKKEVFDRWSEESSEVDELQPWIGVRALANDFFKLRQQLLEEEDVDTRVELQRGFANKLAYALGYEPKNKSLPLDEDGVSVPLIADIRRPSGSPSLWAVPIVDNEAGEFADPLKLHIHPMQFSPNEREDLEQQTFTPTVEEFVTQHLFGAEDPPRFVLLFGETQVILLDRTKWAEKRLLRFDLVEILGRKDTDTIKAFTALAHRDSTCPPDGVSVLDNLDDSSHKHAFGVSKDLKYALREAIEMLGNEAVHYMRYERKEKVFDLDDKDLAADLSLECLRFMYRLLFLLYIEARPELGYAPMQNEAYLKGYSIESLRDLEMVRLHTDDAKNGYYIHDSLKLLFDLIYNGTTAEQKQGDIVGHAETQSSKSFHTEFELFPLKSHLFDPERTPTLGKVRLRNSVMQEIIKGLSLAKQGTGRNKRRGRISYAQLGINQLGAVYEALLSYRGFFAEEDLYEVKKKKDTWDPLETAYFVPERDLDRYNEKERVIDPETNDWMKHPKGKFIYRLAGRDREKSASYYTPESLTKLLVKYALKELLEDDDGVVTKTADEILDIKVCEPAMGSAAFLNEAVNQLSEAYLQQRQRELGERIAHDEYAYEKQRVKTYIADNNVFGVDLNPVAVELAEVSLWLNTIHEGGFVPWFGMQLACGNSLIGARREVYGPEHLKKAKWLKAAPIRVEPGDERPADAIYHWMLPSDEMADYNDYVIKGKGGKNPIEGLAEEEYEQIKEWRKEFCKPLSDDEREALLRLSEAADGLWQRHTEMLAASRQKTTDPFPIYGRTASHDLRKTATRYKDKVWEQELESRGVKAASPYRRLKLAMDYWCALWFWPLEHAGELPTREEFIFELSLLLDVSVLQTFRDRQSNIFPETLDEDEAKKLAEEFGVVDVDALKKRNPRLGLVEGLANRYRYLHWELEFADIFADHGGFDLILGNPPWLKVEWNEGGVMGDVDPFSVVRKHSASKLAGMRTELFEQTEGLRRAYLLEFEGSNATKAFLNSHQNYPALAGIQTNLFKCFLPVAWRVGRHTAVSGYLHPEGVYDDPKGGAFRARVFRRLRRHYQFQNQAMLFPIADRYRYSLNIYGPRLAHPRFQSISNLFVPKTVDECVAHSGHGPVPGIKDDENNWNTNGHRDRVILVGLEELALFANLYDDEGTPPEQARLPAIHSNQLVDVLRKFASQPKRLGDLKDEYFSTEMWHETNAQKDGTIRSETKFPATIDQWVLSGPHFFVGNPLYKTPRAECTEKSHYDVIDLTNIPDDYLPRTNYVPDCSPEEYRSRTPRVPWGNEPLVTDCFRLITRKMLPPPNERTLFASIAPKRVGHIDGAFSLVFRSNEELLVNAAAFSAVPFDFFIKVTGKTNFRNELASQFPQIIESRIRPELVMRSLRLNCLTKHWAPLWNSFNAAGLDRLDFLHPALRSRRNMTSIKEQWNRHSALRSDYDRRLALVETDVLVAIALGSSLSELSTMYSVQFPVARSYEGATWYDQNGRIIFTNSRGLTGVGLPRRYSKNYPDGPYWEDVKDIQSGTVEQTITDDTMPGGPVERRIVYEAPFTRCNREEDYRVVWEEFERRYGKVDVSQHSGAAVSPDSNKSEMEAPTNGSSDTADAPENQTNGDTEVSRHDVPQTDEADRSEIIPQANSSAVLFRVLDALAKGATDADELAEDLSITSRTTHYYQELGAWLGWMSPRRGELAALTDRGSEVAKLKGDERTAAFAEDFWDTPLMQEIVAGDSSLRLSARAALMKRGLADSTAKRRAAAIVSLAEQAGGPPDEPEPTPPTGGKEPDAASEPPEDSKAAVDGPRLILELAQPDLDVQALSPPSLIQNTLQSLDIETAEDLLTVDEEQLATTPGVGKKKIESFRALQARALFDAARAVASPDGSSPVDLMAGWREALPALSVRAFNSLEKTSASTVGDVFKLLKENAITSIPGAGAVTRRDIRDHLLEYFERALQSNVDVPKVRADGHETDSLSVDVLIHLSTRSANAVERHPAATIGELRVALVDGSLAQQKGVGGSSLKEIREHIERLQAHGEEIYRFGERGRPTTYGELVEQILEQSDDKMRAVVEGRLQGVIYEDLGEELGFTRARAQQLFVKAIDDSRLLFGRVAETLMAPEIMKLARPGGLFVAPTEYDANQAEFSLEVAGHEANVVRGRIVTRMTASEVDAVMREVRAALQATGATSVSVEEALDVAEECGLMVEAAEFEFLAFDYLNIRKLAEDRLGFPWSNYGDLLAEVLLDIGAPADTETILARLDQLRPSRPALAELPEFDPHGARSHFQRSEQIWNYGHGHYVHIDCIDLTAEEIRTAAEAGLSRLEGRTDSIGANYLLDDLVEAGEAPDGMTPHLLKDAIHRHPKGLTFHNTLLVAHAESFTDQGVTMTDRLVDLMVSAGEPMKFGAIKKAMAKYGYAETSLHQHIVSTPEFLVLPGGEYTAARALGLTEAAFRTIAEAVLKFVPDDGAVHAVDAIYLQLPDEIRDLLRGSAPSLHVLEAVLRHDDQLEARHGLLARASDEDHLLTKTVELILQDMGCAYPREIRSMLTDAYGYTGSSQAVGNALARLVESGEAIRLPGALYSLRGEDETETWRGWENHHDTLLESGRHQEVDSEDPWSVWTLIRYIERVIDEDDLAEAMMVRMLARDDVPDELRESIHDLKFALSMGMG